MAYRVEFLLEFVGSAVVPLAIQLVLWNAVFRTGEVSTFGGATQAELIAYSLTSVLFSQVRGGDHDFEIVEMIRSGTLSNYLLRPVGVIPFVYIRGIAPRLLFSGLCLTVGLLSCPWTGMDPLRLAGAMGLAFLGNLIHYLFGGRDCYGRLLLGGGLLHVDGQKSPGGHPLRRADPALLVS